MQYTTLPYDGAKYNITMLDEVFQADQYNDGKESKEMKWNAKAKLNSKTFSKGKKTVVQGDEFILQVSQSLLAKCGTIIKQGGDYTIWGSMDDKGWNVEEDKSANYPSRTEIVQEARDYKDKKVAEAREYKQKIFSDRDKSILKQVAFKAVIETLNVADDAWADLVGKIEYRTGDLYDTLSRVINEKSSAVENSNSNGSADGQLPPVDAYLEA